MSKTDSTDTELPEQITAGIRSKEHKRQWLEVKQELARRWGMDIADITHADVARELLDHYNPRNRLHHLRDDQRVQQTVEAIADDHDVDPSDVSLECALKVTCAAYCGYQQTSDWDLNGEEP
jgi:hypothetical protein